MRFSCFLVAFCTVQAMAQTGPGGIGSSANNPIWLSGDRGVYKNAGTTPAASGDAVQQWNNRSGNPRHAQQATLANRPKFAPGAVNGLPVVRFTAASGNRMAATGLNTSTGGKASVWVVASYRTLPSPNPGMLQGTASGNAYSSDPLDKNIGLWVNNTTKKVWGRGIQTNGTSVNVPAVMTLNANTFHILSTQYDGARITQYVNNASAGTATYNGTLRTWPDMSIGVQAGSEGWDGDIAEVIGYTTVLNSTQQVIVANYLAAKYAITLGTDDIYVQDDPANGNYDHEVAGIGRISAASMQTSSRGSGIVQISAPSNLDDNEFLFWGHDNGALGYWGAGDRPVGVQERLARTWRVNEVNRSGAAVDVGAVDITFDLTGLGSVTASDLRLLVDSNNDGSFADEIPIGGAVSMGGGQYGFPGITAIKNNVRFSLGTANSAATPLPIELISFNATTTAPATVELSWATASEKDNAYFTVERSADLANWSAIITRPGAGNSSFQLNYEATDQDALPGLSYYRLRQTDLNGTTTLSDVVPVFSASRKEPLPLVYPNPTVGPFTVRFPTPLSIPARVELMDTAGRVLLTREVTAEGTAQLVIDPVGIALGTHYLRVVSPAGAQVQSILIAGR